MRPLELIRQLDEREFVLLCSVLLKEEISPRVRLVSIAGPDGGRDAWFEGSSASYSGWEGAWLFQFKHYRYDVPSAQRRVLQDLREGVAHAILLYPRLRNYVLVTSVPFTGTPGGGLFDRVASTIDELQSSTGLRIDVWDGLEVASLAALHRSARSLLSPTGERAQIRIADLEEYRLSAGRLVELTDDALLRYVSLLILSNEDPLGPSATSPVATALFHAQFPAVRDVASPALTEVSRRERARTLSPELVYWANWLGLAVALAEVRTGAVRSAVRRTRGLLRRLERPDELAWAQNVLSLAYGKVEDRSKYEAATREAIQRSLEAGNYWLAVTVAMRTVHKSDWAAGEAGMPIPDPEFLELLFHDVADAHAYRLDDQVASHLHGQQQAYLALHLRWLPGREDEAQNALKSASGYFRDAGDQSELTRLDAEDGQLLRAAGTSSDRALLQLQAALRRRLSSGELARARYDLLWLAEVHAERGGTVEAEICGWIGLTIHRTLFGSREVDSRVVQKLRRLLGAGELVLRRRVDNSRMNDDVIFDAAMNATGLSEMDVLRYVDSSAVLAEIRSTDLVSVRSR